MRSENEIEKNKEEYQARICSENCSEKIRALQDVVTSREKKIEDLEYNLEESTQIVTSKINQIRGLENLNHALKSNLEESDRALAESETKFETLQSLLTIGLQLLFNTWPTNDNLNG